MNQAELSETIQRELGEHGVLNVPGLVNLDLIDRLKNQSLDSVELESKKLPSKDHEAFGRLLFAPVYGGAFLELLELKPLMDLAKRYMQCDPILYTMTTSCIPPGGSNYTSRIHRDTSVPIGSLRLMIMQILLDDFNESNGSPLFLRGSQGSDIKPSVDQFDHNAIMVKGKKGSVNFFSPWIWHRSSQNHSDQWRSSILLGFVHPWMKQRFNVRSMLSETDLSTCSNEALCLLGLKSTPPGSWEEYHGNQSPVY